ncbi:MAG: riboflavin synthase [Candidatus Omnitrophica bacterium]|nr:riboflavin synthase [Candidatus Omnitrophota bacterium]MDD5081050.1 riboflavin synthase [Candidatus Omnitrophota bacterium]MDD5441409.1 riboflavin synthase [Candidatus Omnitrophota bacterium]
MFTGIIKEIGTISVLRKGSGLTVVGITAPAIFNDAAVSDSIALNGVCLTVTRKDRRLLFFDIVNPTLKDTNLSKLTIGSRINCETALAVGDKLGGHFVLGHCDALGRVKRKLKKKSYYEIEISFLPKAKKYIIEKGSIAVNGVSLTIKKVFPGSFTVDVIPFTYEHTTFNKLRIGEVVNMECDYLLKAKG